MLLLLWFSILCAWSQLAQKREWREAFKLMDEDRDGTIAVAALGNVLRALGRSLTQAELTDLVNQVAAKPGF